MSSIQHLVVSPKLPTTLADQTHLNLPGHDITHYHVNTVHVIQTKLDVSRFKDALSGVLQLYPHAAGKLRYIDRRWTIELTNTDIPLDIEYKLESSSDSLLDGGWVFQDDLSPFINIYPIGANVFDDSIPLLRVKLTFCDNGTCTGVAWQHSLGDAALMFRFLHTLSQFYQGLSPVFATPNFKIYQFPTPSDAVVAEIWPHIPYLHKSFAFEAIPAPTQSAEHVRLRLDSHDTEELYSALSSKEQNSPSFLKQDCITAYLIAALNYTRSNPVQRVRNMLCYRYIKAPFISENATGNLLLETTAEVPTDMAGIATAVRKAFIQCKDPDYIHSWMTLTSHLKFEAYNAWRVFPQSVGDDELVVNSVKVIDWCSVHFGCPDGTQFHIDGLSKNYIRIARSNPVKGIDGSWKARQSVDISMGVAAEVKPKLLEVLARGVRYMLDD